MGAVASRIVNTGSWWLVGGGLAGVSVSSELTLPLGDHLISDGL